MPARLRAAVRTIADFPEKGILFRDMTPILASSELLRIAVRELSEPFRDLNITRVAGIESRGFILGPMIADVLGTGFIPIRKAGKLPAQTLNESYDLEYGSDSIEVHTDAIRPGDRILIHDDVIATGGTASAARRLVEKAGGIVAGYSFLIEIQDLGGVPHLGSGAPVLSVLPY
ncbi:MAG: adenine phosphoribosyltransferase [Bacteroidetes bacterium]|nr:MAG: adenine phosphoribosyltransferase [Bacteroidota bacterium]